MHYALHITQRLKKFIKSLHQKQFRDENGLFIAEGEKLAEELLNSNHHTELIIVRESSNNQITNLADRFAEKGVAVYIAPKHQFDQLCDTKSPQGIISVINSKENPLDDTAPVIVLDGIADPGNVGTIIRTADWFGYKQIVLGPNSADIYNPKTVRASMGSIFRLALHSTEDLSEFLKTNFPKHKLYGADVNGETSISKIKTKGLYGIVFGSEAHGISAELSKLVTNKFIIEGSGSAESLNVSIAVGISLYHFSK